MENKCQICEKELSSKKQLILIEVPLYGEVEMCEECYKKILDNQDFR